MAFLTLSEYKTVKGITTVANDVQIQTIMELICDHIERYCDRDFRPGGIFRTEYNEGVLDRDGFMLFVVSVIFIFFGHYRSWMLEKET